MHLLYAHRVSGIRKGKGLMYDPHSPGSAHAYNRAPTGSGRGSPRMASISGSELATALLRDYPTAAGFHGVPVRRVAALRYDGRPKWGRTSPPR